MVSTLASTSSIKDPVTSGPGHVFSKYVRKIKVGPQDQSRVSVGAFSPMNPAKGFSVELNANDDDSVIVAIISHYTLKGYELMLDIANHSDKAITADVWQI